MLEITIRLGVCLFFASLFLYKLVGLHGIKKWFLDTPDEDRKLHTTPIPRSGGLVFTGLTLTVLTGLPFFEAIQPLVIGGWAMFVLGLIDDVHRLSWKIKAPAQVGVGIWLICTQLQGIQWVSVFGLSISNQNILYGVLFLVWFLGISNAINLIDGMDSLAGGVSSLILISLLLYGIQFGSGVAVTLTVVLLSSVIGFLVHNSRPAELFMGDTGSLFLGYFFAVIPFSFITTVNNSNYLDITPFLIMYAYIIVDTLRVMKTRYKQKKNPLSPGKEHFHHLLIEATGSYNGTLFLIFSFVSIACLVGLNSVFYSNMFVTMAILFVWGLMIFSDYYKQLSVNYSQKMVSLLRSFMMTVTHKKRSKRRFILELGVFLNLLNLGVAALSQWTGSHFQVEVMIILVALLSYIVLFYKYSRLSFVINASVLAVLVMIEFDQIVTPIYATLIGINLCTLFWVSIGSLKNLLLRHWTVYDMLVLFAGSIGLISLKSLNIVLYISYLMTFYILIKVRLKYSEEPVSGV